MYCVIVKVKDDADLLLMDEIVTGCVRYKSLIRVSKETEGDSSLGVSYI